MKPAPFRKISVTIHTSRTFREMSDDAQLLWFWLLTSPELSALGTLPQNIPGLAAHKGWDIEKTSAAIEELKSVRTVQFDEVAQCFWLPKYLGHNPPAGPNNVTHLGRAIAYVPDCKMREDAILTAPWYGELRLVRRSA